MVTYIYIYIYIIPAMTSIYDYVRNLFILPITFNEINQTISRTIMV